MISDTKSSDEKREATGPSAPREKLVLGVALLCVGLFNIATIRPGQIWSDDVGQYLQHAKNLATGAPYEKTTFIFHPGVWTPGPRAYPPVFPLMLSVVYRWRGADLHLMKVEIVITLLLGIAAIFFVFRREHDFKTRLAAIIIVGVNPIFWEYKDILMPDVIFLFVLYAALAGISATLSTPDLIRRPWTKAIGVGLLCYAAFATKATAIVLLVVPIAFSLVTFRRNLKSASVMTCTCAAAVVTQFLASGDVRSYFELLQTTRANVKYSLWTYLRFYVGSFCAFFDNGHSKSLRWLLFAVLAGLALLGVVRQARKGLRVWEIFAVLYLGLIFTWEQVESRYLFPLFPLFLFYLFSGLVWLTRNLSARCRVVAFALPLAAIATSYVGYYSKANFQSVGESITDAPAQELFAFIRTNSSPQDVTEFSAPRILAFFTEQHTSVYYPLAAAQSDQALWRYLRTVGATYVAVSHLDRDFWTQFVNSTRGCLSLVFANSTFRVYKVKCLADGPNQACEKSDSADNPLKTPFFAGSSRRERRSESRCGSFLAMMQPALGPRSHCVAYLSEREGESREISPEFSKHRKIRPNS